MHAGTCRAWPHASAARPLPPPLLRHAARARPGAAPWHPLRCQLPASCPLAPAPCPLPPAISRQDVEIQIQVLPASMDKVRGVGRTEGQGAVGRTAAGLGEVAGVRARRSRRLARSPCQPLTLAAPASVPASLPPRPCLPCPLPPPAPAPLPQAWIPDLLENKLKDALDFTMCSAGRSWGAAV